jgi:tetratricopeptide (TPR) repeat protein
VSPVAGTLGQEGKRAYQRAEAAARLRGAVEALGVLRSRPPGDPLGPGRYAMALLAGHVSRADWNSAGLPALPAAPGAAEHLVPVSDRAVMCLARAAMQFHCAELRIADRPAHWARLAKFFAQRLPASDPDLARLRERVCIERVDAGDTSPDVVGDLRAALDHHRETDGEHAYITGLARANLSVAYRQRGTGADLAEATRLARAEAQARTARYGPAHPVTLVARSLLARSLLVQAEAADDPAGRRHFARDALAEITDVRVARDRMYGVTAPNATRSRRHEARALLLLGELDRARACLEHTLTFERIHSGGREHYETGQTHLVLARVYAAQGNRDRALEHARRAHRILSVHNPGSTSSGQAAALVAELGSVQAGPVPPQKSLTIDYAAQR